jgi:hypothetical protein
VHEAAIELDEIAIGLDAHAEFEQLLLDAVLLQGIDGPCRDALGGRHERHLEVFAPQFLGEHRADVKMVVIENHGRRGHAHAGHQIIGREHAGALEAGDRAQVRACDPVSAPVRTGCEHDAPRPEFEDLGGRDPAGAQDFDIRQSVELLHPVVAHARPGGQSR